MFVGWLELVRRELSVFFSPALGYPNEPENLSNPTNLGRVRRHASLAGLGKHRGARSDPLGRSHDLLEANWVGSEVLMEGEIGRGELGVSLGRCSEHLSLMFNS